MARINNSIDFGSGFNIGSTGPIDSRMLVEFERDLTDASNWPSNRAPLYDGLTVTVKKTGDIWILKDVNHSGDTESGLGWKKSGNVNIDDEATSSASTWSSEKIVTELGKVGFSVEIVDVLPESGDSHTVYFLEPQESGDTSSGETLEVQESGGTDFYEEYMWIDDRWELIGTTKIDLSDYYTKSKVNELLAEKQDVLSAGTNIIIDSTNTISADGYVFDSTNGAISTKYKQDDEDGGQIVANIATGLGAVAEGYNTQSTGGYGSHAEGEGAIASGSVSHAEGHKTQATAQGAHAEGYKTQATGKYSHTEGDYTVASNRDAHAEGWYTNATGRAAHTEGLYTDATGDYSHAEGWGLENLHNLASGDGAHTEGIGTKATNMGAHAEGYGSEQAPNTASAPGSHVEGCITIALNKAEHAEGAKNVSHKASDTEGNSGNTLSSIGMCFDGNHRRNPKNAREVMQNGDYYMYGVGGYDGVHIKGEVSGTTVQTVQEVINNKQDTLKAVTIADDGSALTITLSANTLYSFTTRESDLTISLGVPTPGIVNEYHLTIAIGANVPNVDWPNNWTWFGDGAEPSLSPNKTYEVSILNNIAVYIEI